MEGDLDPHPPPGCRQGSSVRVTTRKGQAVRQYDDPVEVRSAEGPEQFLWRGRLWQVREVVAHWIETGAWWLRRPEEHPGRSELRSEREVWRVTAARGRAVATADDPGFGVFDLTFDPVGGVWALAGSVD